MPLAMMNSGREYRIVNINGSTDLRMKLVNMGITPGVAVRIISKSPSSLLIGLRDTRIMLNSGIAHQIQVQ
ncbi:MAG TPA: ferrous iron transport protein A [Firmicutes bacterium]|nr:ferrous iron transport protein A [Bacillota bacterium]HWR56510.1 FeoA family protein [Negativicutes bacterium]